MRATRTDAVAATVLVVCWSSGFVGAVLGTRSAPVDTVLAWRTLVSALVLGAWALVRGERVAPRALLRQVVLGLLVQVLYLGGIFAAAGAGVSAGTSALVAASSWAGWGTATADGPAGAGGSRRPCGYCRDIARRISLSWSRMRSPDRSTVTVCRVPVNRNGRCYGSPIAKV